MKNIFYKIKEVQNFIKENITVPEKIFILGAVLILISLFRISTTLGIFSTGLALMALALLLNRYID